MPNSRKHSVTLIIPLLLISGALLAPRFDETTHARQQKRARPAATQKDRQMARPGAKQPEAKKPEAKSEAAVAAPAGSQRRVALVIGNGDYPEKDLDLTNPVNDAELIAGTLRGLGFEVLERKNASRQEMLEAVQAFGSQLGNRGIGLFYYAGHGVQLGGRNYLVPTNFGNVASSQDIEKELLYAGEVLDKMATKQGLNIVVLDACRNNPTELGFPAGVKEGFAEIKNTPAGTFIAFSTSPGDTAADGAGENSPYTKALVESLRMRPSRLEDVFIHTRLELDRTTNGRQVPWENSSLKSVFFFTPDEVAGTPLPNLTPTSPLREELLKGLLGGLKQFTFHAPQTGPGGSVTARRTGRASFYTEDVRGAGLEMVEIPGGRFLMGSNFADADAAYADSKRYNDEATRDTVAAEMPQHNVNVPGFYMSKYEVTQRQWQAVMGSLPRLDPKYRGDDLPVVNVNWREAEAFCERLSQLTGRQYRLPSEAEWEYACRAGTNTPYAFGPNISPQLSNYNGGAPFAGAAPGNYRQSLTTVGQTSAANAFGLYDMHGNAWEWCADNWHASYDGAPTDGSMWEATDEDNRPYRVIRGGSWDSIANSCRSASRRKQGARIPGSNKIGFRVAAS